MTLGTYFGLLKVDKERLRQKSIGHNEAPRRRTLRENKEDVRMKKTLLYYFIIF